jgi:hypothetical protein
MSGRVAGDQIPIDRLLGEQLVDVLVHLGGRRPVPLQLLPVANARHQLDAQQERQPVHRRTLRLGVAVEHVRLDVGRVLRQAVEDVDGFPHAARDEVAEQRDVGVRDMVVGDSAVAAIADVALCEQIVLVEVPLRAVGRGTLRVAPIAWQLKLVVAVDDVADRRLQLLGADLALIDEGDLARADVAFVSRTAPSGLRTVEPPMPRTRAGSAP